MAAKKVSGTKEQKPVEPVDTAGVVAPVERRVVACNAQFITVDAGKLSKGLKTTFEGVAMVFDSIGLPVQLGLTMDLEDGVSDEHSASGESADPVAPAASAESTAPAAEKVAVKKKAKADPKPEPASESTAVVETQEEEESAPAAEDVVESAPAAEPETKEAPAEEVVSVSSITIDDITKIIVQKIRQNRNTNEKIAAILKTYGVAKVSELPVDKYEAFLTDLSAI